MSVSFNGTTGVVTVTGTDNLPGDIISVRVQNGLLQVTDNNVVSSFTATKVKKLVINAGFGEDHVTLAPSVAVPSVIDTGPGGSGGDRIQGGSGNDTIYVRCIGGEIRGGAGNDTIHALGGLNSHLGEAGNDTFKISSGSVSTESGYVGGDGNDTVDFSAVSGGLLIRNGSTGPYVANSGTPPQLQFGMSHDALNGIETFIGTQGNDYIYGNHRDNYIDGQSGNDYIRGGDGNDTLIGGSGEDALYGDNGADQFFSRDGTKDFLSGGAGTDKARRDAVDILNSIEGSL